MGSSNLDCQTKKASLKEVPFAVCDLKGKKAKPRWEGEFQLQRVQKKVGMAGVCEGWALTKVRWLDNAGVILSFFMVRGSSGEG